MRVAVISDIHGNAFALEAVLDDIRRNGADAVLNLGDHFYGPLDPVRTAAILAGLDMIAIRGNTDRIVLARAESVHGANARGLTQDTLAWLRELPGTERFEDQIVLTHGTPASDETYWLDRESGHGFRAATLGEVEAELPETRFPLYCCGHTHVARIVSLADGRTVFNPGSVGRPSFTMSDPVSAARAGPEAAYALLTRSQGAWTIDLRQVPYDHQAAAALARANGKQKWEKDLLYGRRR